MTFYPAYYNNLETNIEITKSGLVRRVKKEWCKTNKLGIIDFNKLKPHKNGYISLTILVKGIGSRHLLLHQIIASTFLNYVIGGKMVVDHIDDDKRNNRLENLQVIKHRENILKSFKGTTIYPQGIYYDSSKSLYRARVQVNKKKIHLGYYKNPNEASKVYFDYIKSLPC